jgi:enoyl-CoA hydratase/carnithine racemase
MTAHIVTEIDKGVMTIRFNRPDKRNAVTSDMYGTLVDAFTKGENDRAVRAMVLTGAGEFFCAGNDLNDFLQNPPVQADANVYRVMKALNTVRKPLIAAVNGPGIGVGATILLHCDLVYAAPTAYFLMPFVNLAIVPEFGSSLLLPRAIGTKRAMEMLLLGEPMNAQDALASGLITGIVEADKLAAHVNEVAAKLVEKSAASIRIVKQLVLAAPEEIAARQDMENQLLRASFQTPEMKEAVQAFKDKRKPNFAQFE